jgi:recombination protein RecA
MSQNILDLLKKKYKTNIYASTEVPSIELVSTGIATLDIALGGGLAKGRIAEIYGPESVGKSSVCLAIAEAAVKRGEIVLYEDLEKTVTSEAIANNNLETENFIVTRPRYGEEAIDQAVDFIKAGGNLIILDTVAMLMPKSVYEKIDGDSEARDVSSTAGFLNRVKNKITDHVEFNQAVFIFVNQIRDNLASMHGGTSTPGGHAIKHAYSQRIRITHAVKDPNIAGRVRSQVKIEKNKVGTPYLSCEIPIVNGVVQKAESLLTAAIDIDVVIKRGNWYYLPATEERQEVALGNGAPKSAQALVQNPEYLNLVSTAVTNSIAVSPEELD